MWCKIKIVKFPVCCCLIHLIPYIPFPPYTTRYSHYMAIILLNGTDNVFKQFSYYGDIEVIVYGLLPHLKQTSDHDHLNQWSLGTQKFIFRGIVAHMPINIHPLKWKNTGFSKSPKFVALAFSKNNTSWRMPCLHLNCHIKIL